MSRIYPRIFALLILPLASSACGAGSPAQPAAEIASATITQFVLPPETTPTFSEPPGSESEGSAGATPTLPMEAPGASTVTSMIEVTNTVAPTVYSSGLKCNDAVYVVDVAIPDGTTLAPGEIFTKTWRLKNIGYCQWTTSYAIGYAYGVQMDGTDTKLPNTVDPGDKVDVSVVMIAPKDIGWYTGWWRLKTDTGVYFGEFIYVSIQVASG